MRERPILFSGPMVRSILEGRKSQTRRVVKFTGTPPSDAEAKRQHPIGFMHETGFDGVRCPYGQPEDRLWVRETLLQRNDGSWMYAADKAPVTVPSNDSHRVLRMVSWAHHKEGSTCVSIHMPRWASRLTLEVTEVRVQRLQEISEEDARAEGVAQLDDPFQEGTEYWACQKGSCLKDGGCSGVLSARASFETLWDSINGERPGCAWGDNPWVWAVSFSVVPR